MNDLMNDVMNNAMNKDASNDNANAATLRGNALLTDKVAIITGAAQGIGFACAARFGAEGAKVVLGDINCDAGEAAAKQLRERGIDARHQVCDVGRESSIDALLDFAEAAHGRIDCAIANAGIVKHVDPLTMSIDDFDAVLTVNLRGVVLTGQRAAQRMIRQPPDENGARGCIINMSSINAIVAIPEIAPYIVAKGGVNQWTKCLGIRLAQDGVRVNAIGPGSINTEMFHAIADNPQKYRAVLSRTPIGRPGEPDEVAKVAVFLACDYSSYLIGETVYPDGGRLGLNYFVKVDDNA